jgi:putative ABC transport system permease protein
VKLWGEEKEIVGVVRDFNFETFHEQVKPVFFFLAPQNAGNIMIRIETGQEQETLARLEKFYTTFNPGFPFNYRFLDEDYQELYTAERRVATLSRYFAVLAVLISCLGLFGLAAFTAERRMKEIGIRKILGSSNRGIVYLLSGEFTKMVLIAVAIALPASYYIVTLWLEGFVFRIDIQWWFFACSGLAALLIAWLTVGIQTLKAARINPTECLKNE